MIKFTIKVFSFLVGIMLILSFIVFPAITASNTIQNLGGLFLIFAIIILILRYGPSVLADRILDEDEMRQVYETKEANENPTDLSDTVEPNPKRKRTFVVKIDVTNAKGMDEIAGIVNPIADGSVKISVENPKPKRKYNRKPKTI